ncbi:ATP-dependent DNA helicase HFM1-like [Oopsacas minuta]|uniref:DNA 3'-5' helicase n=1 Tax=Oopsacas minuta TaxID=111878 RepID=A0AAV7KDD1_9METZ|nr:ATP-dependent DNA helicase HFM1-like [Oopsacas minuta]
MALTPTHATYNIHDSVGSNNSVSPISTHRIPFSYPSPLHPHIQRHTQLRPVSEIVSPYNSIFTFPYFNLVQSLSFDPLLYSEANLVISAPTGSGKTGVFELAIVRWLLQESMNVSHPPTTKCVYMAPIKALCSERFQDWSQKLSPFNISCLELTGDSESDDFFILKDVQLILTTPEKWDSMTRKWKDNRSLVEQIRLFLVDEIHLLNDPHRGPTIEAVISRMKTIHSSSLNSNINNPGIRLVAASATIPNCEDIAEWFGEGAKVVRVDESQRPVPLTRIVLPYSSRDMSEFKFDISLSYKLRSVIQSYSEGKPTLIFCSTRKGTQQAACVLAKDGLGMSIESRRSLEQQALFLKDSKLRELFSVGIAFHHAGLYTEDRRTVESAFVRGCLPVLFSTSTLAMGVNLPAHLVIIKSTQQYVEGAFREYSEPQVLQMVGRAGRPQFDTHATAVIMTRNETCSKYETFLSGLQTVESYLHQNLIEHLNAEVVLGTIEEVIVALKWIKSTFLYVRVRRNPSHYLGEDNTLVSEDYLDKKLQEMCLKDLQLLNEAELIKLNPNSRFITPTPLGRLMARFCLSFPTMKKLISLNLRTQNLGDTLLDISELQEFYDVKLRISEKKVLNSLNRDKQRTTIRHPMKGKIKTTAMKVNCLIQATLGCIPFQDFTLTQDVQRIFRNAYRVSRCLLEIQLLREDFSAIHHSACLHQCINAKLWLDSHFVSKQLEKVGPTISNCLVQAGLTTFNKISETNPRQLELITNRHPPFGTHVINSVSSLPNYSLDISQRLPPNREFAMIDIVLRLNNSLDLVNTNKKSHSPHSCLLIIGDPADSRIFAKYRITDSFVMQKPEKNVSYFIKVPFQNDHKISLKIHLKSLKFVGLDINRIFTPKFLLPIRVPNQQQQQQQQNASTIKVGASQNFDLGQSYYTDSPTKQNLYSKENACSHRCYDKQLCGHTCCKNDITNVCRDSNKAKREDSYPYRNSRSSRMNTFMEEVNNKQDLLPATGFSMRLKQSAGALQEFAYQPTQYKSHTDNTIYELPSPKFLENNAELDNENYFDFFPEDFDIEGDLNGTPIPPRNIPKPFCDSTEDIEQLHKSKHIPTCIVEPIQRSADYSKLNSRTNNSLSDENEDDFYRCKRKKLIEIENTFQNEKQPNNLTNIPIKQSIIPAKFNESKPSFFLTKMELDSVCPNFEQDDFIDFF